MSADNDPGGRLNPDDPSRDAHGRFRKNHSGNWRGRPRKARQIMPLDVAHNVLNLSQKRVAVAGQKEKVTILQASLTQLAYAAARGEKGKPEKYLKIVEEAARVVAHKKEQEMTDLGRYLRLKARGKAPPLSQKEAAHFQQLADEAGIDEVISAAEPLEADSLQVHPEEIERIQADLKFGLSLRAEMNQHPADVIRRVLVADRRLNRRRG